METDGEAVGYRSTIAIIECLSAPGMLAILLLSQQALHADQPYGCFGFEKQLSEEVWKKKHKFSFLGKTQKPICGYQ